MGFVQFHFHLSSIRWFLPLLLGNRQQRSQASAVMVFARLPSFSAAFEFGFLLQIKEEAALAAALNDYLSSRSYLAGFGPSQADRAAWALLRRPPHSGLVHALRWYRHVAALRRDAHPESSRE